MWKEIEGTNGEYKVSDDGKVMTTKTGRILKPNINYRGYEKVCLFKADRKKRVYVHRLVAMTFIPNPEDKPQVNHIDGDKRNNKVSNLEWVTNEENMKHSVEMGLRANSHNSKKKRILAINIDTGERREFESILSASKAIGTNHIPQVLKGERHQAKGYTFQQIGGDA